MWNDNRSFAMSGMRISGDNARQREPNGKKSLDTQRLSAGNEFERKGNNMSQIVANIYVKVKDPKMWEKLYDLELDESYGLNAKVGKEIFGNIEGDEWYITEEWSPEDPYTHSNGLRELAKAIVRALGNENCILLAQETDLNTDPQYIIHYNFDEDSGTGFNFLTNPGWPEPSILDPEKWIKWAGIRMTPHRLKFCGNFSGRFDYIKKSLSPKEKRTRFYIAVKDTAIWNKLDQIDLNMIGIDKKFDEAFSKHSEYEKVLKPEWTIPYGNGDESKLYDLALMIKKVVGTGACIVLADNADPDESFLREIVYLLDTPDVSREEIAKDTSKVSVFNVLEWMQCVGIKITGKRKEYLETFPIFDINESDRKADLTGLSFVVTGDLYQYSDREVLKHYIELCGGNMRNSVSAKTSFLITNTPNSGTKKNLDAKKLGIPIITESEFISRFSGGEKISEAKIALNPHKTKGVDDSGTLVIPEKTTKIAKGEFKGMNGITSVIIPDSVTEIGAEAFKECKNLETVVLPEKLKKIGKGAFKKCLKLKNVTFPKNLKTIGDVAFEGCKEFTGIILNEGLETVGDEAFQYCQNVKEVYVPGTLKTVSRRMFRGNYSLTDVTLSEGVKKLEDCCFERCKKLQNITFPSSIEEVGTFAFYDCNKFLSGIKPNEEVYVASVLLKSNKEEVIVREDAIGIAPNVISKKTKKITISPSTFNHPSFEIPHIPHDTKIEVVLLEGISKIVWIKGLDQSAIHRITIPSSVTYIEDYAIDRRATICAKKGSYAELYAKEHDIQFQEIE